MRGSIFLAVTLLLCTVAVTRSAKWGDSTDYVNMQQFQDDMSEAAQLDASRWNTIGWIKYAGSSFWSKSHLLVYLNVEQCVAKFLNGTCYEYKHSKSLFFPRVDHLSRLELNNSFLSYANDTSLTISLSVKNGTLENGTNTFYTTPKKHYIDSRGQYVVGSWTAFITLEKGYPTKIEWEEGCDECFMWCGACRPGSTQTAATQVDCGTTEDPTGEYKPYDRDCNPGKCIDNICAVSKTWDCAGNSTQCVNCDMQTCNAKVYIGWKGTDWAGRVLTSYGAVPSIFRKFSFSPAYRQAAGIWSKTETFLLVGA